MTNPYVPGYESVLVRKDVKTLVRKLRDRLGLVRESRVERCLTTALLDLALAHPSLEKELLARFQTAAEEDLKVTAVAPAPCSSSPQPSPLTGTVSRASRD